jgi:acyl phosphate:glycerol-3-phosphate acyltransferase
MPEMFLIGVGSYLLGSVPFGYLLVRIFRGEDVRQAGSGNIGATNVSRKSPALGALTLALDAIKGVTAVELAYHFSSGVNAATSSDMAMTIAAFLAVVGHMFPVWLKFRGGKGVATALGSFLVIAPRTVLIAAGVFVVVVVIFRYVSLGSIVAAGIFPFLLVKRALAKNDLPALMLVAATSLLIIVRHHENLKRLFAGTESRIGAKQA